MRVIVFESPDRAAESLGQEILEALSSKPNLVLGLATGSTPLRVYSHLVRAHRERGVDFSGIRTFNLDEYLDLPRTHPQSYRYFMQAHLFDGVNLRPENIHFPPSEGSDLTRRCREYEERIVSAGGIDIQILGIGSNGHIGFNEPTSSLSSRTRIKTLTDRTLRDNSRFYGPDEHPPEMAATMGIGTILEAKKILLHAFGHSKAQAVLSAVEGPISSYWPASVLQLHADVTFFLDRQSSATLSQLSYYERVVRDDRQIRDRE